MNYYTYLIKLPENQETFHYAGDLSHQELLPMPDLLIIEERPEGIFLVRYKLDGTEVGDTWHESIKDAKDQADYEYKDNINEWQQIPDKIKSSFDYALSQSRKN